MRWTHIPLVMIVAAALAAGASPAEAGPFSAWQRARQFRRVDTASRLQMIASAPTIKVALALAAAMPELKGAQVGLLQFKTSNRSAAKGAWITAVAMGREAPQLVEANHRLQLDNGRLQVSVQDQYMYHAHPMDDFFSTKTDSRQLPIRTGFFRNNTDQVAQFLPGLTTQLVADGVRAALGQQRR